MLRAAVPALMTAALLCLIPAAAECSWWTFTLADPNAGGNALVESILQDHAGNLWFASPGGLTRFDGLQWRTYTTADGLPYSSVTSLAEDRDGALWVGTGDNYGGGGVSRFDGGTWRTYTTADGLVSNLILAVTVARDGSIWVGTKLGACRFDGSRWRTYQPGLEIFRICEDQSGVLWFASFGGGLLRYDGTAWTAYTTENTVGGMAGNTVGSVFSARDGSIWLSSGDVRGFMVSRLSGGTWTRFPQATPHPGQQVGSILEDREGVFWFSVYGGGVTRYNGAQWRYYGIADGLPDNLVLSSLEDRAGALWFGLQQGVIARFDKAGWGKYAPPGWTSGVYAATEDSTGRLWFYFGEHGVARFDGVDWTTYSAADSIPANDGPNDFRVLYSDAMTDRSGNVWFVGNGLYRFDGTRWANVTPAGGLPGYAERVLQAQNGDIWVGTLPDLSRPQFPGGVLRFDGIAWTTYTSQSTSGGLVSNSIQGIAETPDGAIWFSHGFFGEGVSRFDGTSWRTYTTADGLADNVAAEMLVDRTGALWVFSAGGEVSRFDGSAWTAFPSVDAAAEVGGVGFVVGRDGDIWIGGGVDAARRFDHGEWTTFTSKDGLPASYPAARLQDRGGSIWFSSASGALRFDPDRVPPSTRFILEPPPSSSARDQAASSTTAFDDLAGITYSFRLDAGPWTDWSSFGTWSQGGLADGAHLLEARTRDHEGNIDPFPAQAPFVVDATPPRPIIAAPLFGQAVRGMTDVSGTAADARFLSFRLEVSPTGATAGPPKALAQSTIPVLSGRLGSWDTSSFADGLYDLRLSVTDSLGLTGAAQITVAVDNQFPPADKTSPARIVAESGGDIYTTNADAHLYFPPRAFAEDAVVTFTPNVEDSVPASLPVGATRVLAGYELAWGPSGLRKPARFELALPESAFVGTPAIYFSTDGRSWRRQGGTVESSGHRIATTVTVPGRYGLFVDSGVGVGDSKALSALAFTPRVFSPTGAFADRQVTIGFTLGRTSPVTVRIYNRAGRLVREIASHQTFEAGANLVRWDGKDRGGALAADGMYLVTVEALGQTERGTLAIVR